MIVYAFDRKTKECLYYGTKEFIIEEYGDDFIFRTPEELGYSDKYVFDLNVEFK